MLIALLAAGYIINRFNINLFPPGNGRAPMPEPTPTPIPEPTPTPPTPTPIPEPTPTPGAPGCPPGSTLFLDMNDYTWKCSIGGSIPTPTEPAPTAPDLTCPTGSYLYFDNNDYTWKCSLSTEISAGPQLAGTEIPTGPIAVYSESIGIVGGAEITYAASAESLASFLAQSGVEPESYPYTISEATPSYELSSTGEIIATYTSQEQIFLAQGFTQAQVDELLHR